MLVAWDRFPNKTAGLTVTGYDLRHIRTDDDETIESNWTVLEDVWTAAAGGALEYTIDGLVPRERHDRAGGGPRTTGVTGDWSASRNWDPGERPANVYRGQRQPNRSILENSQAGQHRGQLHRGQRTRMTTH